MDIENVRKRNTCPTYRGGFDEFFRVERLGGVDATTGPGRVLPPRRGHHSAVRSCADGLAGSEYSADLHRYQVPVHAKVSDLKTTGFCMTCNYRHITLKTFKALSALIH